MEANNTSHHMIFSLQLYTQRSAFILDTASNQSWTLEWPGNEVNEVMQQLNQSAPDAQSLHIVAMEIACQ